MIVAIRFSLLLRRFTYIKTMSQRVMIDILLSFFKWLGIAIAMMLIIGIVYEQFSRRFLEKEILENHTFVEINGKPLHYLKKGQGNYTIVFVSGMGSSHAIWQDIQEDLSQHAVTLSYDRNGLMWSDAAGIPVLNENVSQELEMLLAKTNCPKPYLLVGHSMASIYLRPFIQKHKAGIKGVVFVEGAHPQQIKKSSTELLQAQTFPPQWLIKFVVETGIYRLWFSFFPLSAEIPMDHQLNRMERDYFYRSYKTTLEELDNDRLNFKDAEPYDNFGNIPLTVIMGSSDIRYQGWKSLALINEHKKLVTDLQHDHLKLSSDSRLVEAKNSGHIVQIKDSKLIVSAIEKMML